MKRSLTLVLGVLALACGTAHATDGYFENGYGMQALGRGGTTMADPDNAFAGANNPATLVWADHFAEFGLNAFRPLRSASRSELGAGLDGSAHSGHDWFPIPEFAYGRKLDRNLAVGVSVYGNGGMNTDYPTGQFDCGRGPANILCGSTALGVNLMQLFIAPTVAYRFAGHQSIGIAPLFAFQRFTAKGLQAFAAAPGLSVAPDEVTNRGASYSHGIGFRFGYFVRFNPQWAFGASYSAKLHMSRFTKYAGLFAGNGSFNIPENYSAGVSFKPTDPWTLSLDYQRINYSDVRSVGPTSRSDTQLGSVNGPGFGWHDVNVWKFGVEYAGSPRWIWRAGFDHSDNPIRNTDVTFNILAPGVVMNQLTFGVSYRTQSGGEWTLAYMHAFQNSVSGPSILPVFMGGQPGGIERIALNENSLGVAFRWKL